jgi:hypothetical protein
MESNWVHSALRPPMAYCTSPWWLWWWRKWWNDWQGKPKYSEKTCPSTALSTTNTTCCPNSNPGRRGEKPETNRLSYGTAKHRSKKKKDLCVNTLTKKLRNPKSWNLEYVLWENRGCAPRAHFSFMFTSHPCLRATMKKFAYKRYSCVERKCRK